MTDEVIDVMARKHIAAVESSLDQAIGVLAEALGCLISVLAKDGFDADNFREALADVASAPESSRMTRAMCERIISSIL